VLIDPNNIGSVMVATAPCSVYSSQVFEAVGLSSLPYRDSLAVIRDAWSKPTVETTLHKLLKKNVFYLLMFLFNYKAVDTVSDEYTVDY
jgi:hypothetical protein